ncbi:hypothetical protein REPUB_Repub05bG0203300 [Reevesia pubescens]
MSKPGEVVCVTGASGSIGSWLVKLLLDRGYNIRHQDEKETKHLESLDGAESRLRLFRIDLLDYDSIDASDKIKTEDCWTNIEYCKQNELWYPISKLLAEIAAWEFSKEKGLDVVVVNPIPDTVMGPNIPPNLNASMVILLRLLQGCKETYQDFSIGFVHYKDVALAHILVYENKSATGRHICVEAISHYGDFVAKVAELYPEYIMCPVCRGILNLDC